MKRGAIILVVLVLAGLIFGGQLISGRTTLVTERNRMTALRPLPTMKYGPAAAM